MSNFQLTDTMWSVLIPVMVNPFGVYLARAYSSGAIPGELLEAARLDAPASCAPSSRSGCG